MAVRSAGTHMRPLSPRGALHAPRFHLSRKQTPANRTLTLTTRTVCRLQSLYRRRASVFVFTLGALQAARSTLSRMQSVRWWLALLAIGLGMVPVAPAAWAASGSAR